MIVYLKAEVSLHGLDEAEGLLPDRTAAELVAYIKEAVERGFPSVRVEVELVESAGSARSGR